MCRNLTLSFGKMLNSFMTCLVFISFSSRLDNSITMKQFSISSKLSGATNFQRHLSVPFQKLFGKQKYLFIVLSLYSFRISEVHEMGNFNTWRYRFGYFQFLLSLRFWVFTFYCGDFEVRVSETTFRKMILPWFVIFLIMLSFTDSTLFENSALNGWYEEKAF